MRPRRRPVRVDAGVPLEVSMRDLLEMNPSHPESRLPQVLGYVWERHPLRYAYRLRPA